MVVRSFVADVTGTAGRATLAWQAPERLAYRPARGVAGQPVVTVGGLTMLGLFPQPERGQSELVRRGYAARPDAYSYVGARFGEPVDVAVARARSGALRLAAGRYGRRPAWRTRVALPPNDCAGLPRGAASFWLDRATLLPLEIRWQRGRRLNERVSVRYRALNRRVPRAYFRRPALGRRPLRRDQAFVRTSPSAADRRVSYDAELPASLPRGFSLAVAGWAPRSGRTGPETSNPRYAQLFAAVYRRGWERIDVTQRLAGGRGWLSNPFGFECGIVREQQVDVGAVRATYGEGPEIVPHLYWREGNVLHTISGPLPRAELVAIAESLERVG